MNSTESTRGNGQKVVDANSSSASMTLQDGNKSKASAKDHKECSVARRNTDNRCSYFTLLTPDSNGNWRMVAVPFNCLNVELHTGSRSQSFTDGTFSGSKLHHHRRSKYLTSKVRKEDALVAKSVCQSSFNSNGLNVTNLSDNNNGAAKMRKSGKKNNAKKSKKKGKRDRKITLDAGSSKNTDSGTGSNSWETASTVLSPDSCSNSSEDNIGGSINYSEIAKAYTADIDRVDALKANCGDNSEISETNDSLFLSSNSVSSFTDDVVISSSSSMDMKNNGSRKVPRTSNVSKKSSSRTFHDHSADKNNTSWREVSANTSDKWSSASGKMNSFECQGVNSSKLASVAEKNCNVSQSELLSKGDDMNQSKVGDCGNSKRRTSAGSKQELNCHSSKSSYASKSTSDLYTELGTEIKNAEDFSPHFGQKKWSDGTTQPLSKVHFKRIESNAEKIDSSTFGKFNKSEGRFNKFGSPEGKYLSSSCSLNDQTASQECKLIKDPELVRSDLPNISEYVDKEAVENLKMEGLRTGKDVSTIEHNKNDQISGPSMYHLIPVGIKDSKLARSNFSNNSHCVDKEAVKRFMSENATMDMALPEALDCSVNNNSFETAIYKDSDKILQAVNDAYKAQLAAKSVEKAIGCPVAEVERFLRAASPFIPVSNNISPCGTCLPNKVSVAPLCRHNMPILSLGNMWEWYEKHGTFGLEVKAEDYDNSKRLGIDRFAFCAYFVPFLSAVQLFRSRRTCSSVGVPIFSVLIPQPKIVGSVTEKFNDSKSSDEFELVYEYFEAERPQHRRPLFEMIKNLISGGEPVEGSAFGDPSKLASMAIKDLHPRSWYSVAWYPIYRIPDEKFQSAFLTYHSLGHLVHTKSSSDSSAGNGSVVSPVVGLQSYNTQGECWLRPRNSPEEVILNYDPCEIFKERLRTLEHTAFVMARAEVVKGNATSVNKQPDYEFFLSRRRW